MTFNPALTTQDIIWLVEIEAVRRLEDCAWTIADSPNTDCYYVAHPEGKPSRVKELLVFSGIIITYAEQVSLADCQATPSSWYWDTVNSRLYIHTSTDADPSTSDPFLINSYFWERIADRVMELDGHPYRPLLDPSSIADLGFEATRFSTGGISQSFGSVRTINEDGYWDTRLADYVYEGKRIVVKFGNDGDAYADYIKLFDGYTGGNKWTDASVEFETEDPRRFQE